MVMVLGITMMLLTIMIKRIFNSDDYVHHLKCNLA